LLKISRLVRLHAPLLSVSLLVACASREPARFSGTESEPRVGAESVIETGDLPRGYKALGTVRSKCTARERVWVLEDAPLEDVACSEALLTAALRAKAAEVGGEVLIGRKCSTKTDAGSHGERVDAVTCRARVGRSPDAAPYQPAPPPLWTSELAASIAPADVYRIDVDFDPAQGEGGGRVARREDRVTDVTHMPASQVPYGDIVARCDGDCERASVRDAVRATAARVGADGVVGIACARHEGEWLCTGKAAVYEVDPGTHPEAR
jgi:hypothetical protein